MSESTARVGRFIDLLERGEDWLMRRVLDHAIESGFSELTSTLEEAWRVSIIGLTNSQIACVREHGLDLAIKADERLAEDPVTAFGIIEARQHHDRGISVSAFIAFMSYYELAYREWVRVNASESDREAFVSAVEWFFRRLQAAFVEEHERRMGTDALDEMGATNRSLVDMKNRYLTTFASLQVPVAILSAEGRILDTNDEFGRLFGISNTPGASHYSAVAVGTSFEPLRERIDAFVAADLCAEDFEARLETAVGPRHYVVSVKRLLDISEKFQGITVALTDITERKQIEEAHRTNWERYSALFENMTAAFASHMLVRDESGTPVDYVFLEVNPAFEAMTGLVRSDVLGRGVVEVVPGTVEDEFDWVGTYGQVVDTQQPIRFTHFSEGLDRYLDIAAFPTGGDGFGVVFSDVSALHRSNAELERIVRQRTGDLVAANADLTRASRVKSQFLASMSHELRTPLNAIIGFSGILGQGLAGSLNDEQSHQVQMIRTSGQRLLDLVNQILDLARIEADRTVLELSDFDVRAAIGDALAEMEPLFSGRPVRLMRDLPVTQLLVHGDRAKFEQVLINLVTNAAKFTSEGMVHVRARLTDEGRELVLSVQDSGCGIEAGKLDRVFEEFAQFGRPHDGAPLGSGLGLVISRRLARLMGGDIVAASVPGHGSTFRFTMPVQLADESDLARLAGQWFEVSAERVGS